MKVTALLICFNQEEFVQAAVRDLFAQDFKNLEIILSDDCSSDGTFDIILEEFKYYRGPHRVCVNRNSFNLGLNRHINSLVSKSSGDLIIPFAGDDRFRADRVRKLAELCAAEDSLLVHSYADFIGVHDAPVSPIHKNATLYNTFDLRQIARSPALFIGATAAWHRDLFTKYGPLPETLAYEDLILGFRAALEGRISLVEESLVKYRVGAGTSFQSQKLLGHSYRERRTKNLKIWKNVLLARLADATTYGLSNHDPVVMDLELELFDVKARLALYGENSDLLYVAKHKPARFLQVAASELNRSLRKRV